MEGIVLPLLSLKDWLTILEDVVKDLVAIRDTEERMMGDEIPERKQVKGREGGEKGR